MMVMSIVECFVCDGLIVCELYLYDGCVVFFVLMDVGCEFVECVI